MEVFIVSANGCHGQDQEEYCEGAGGVEPLTRVSHIIYITSGENTPTETQSSTQSR